MSIAENAAQKVRQQVEKGQSPSEAFHEAINAYPSEVGHDSGATYARFHDYSFLCLRESGHIFVLTNNYELVKAGRIVTRAIVDKFHVPAKDRVRENVKPMRNRRIEHEFGYVGYSTPEVAGWGTPDVQQCQWRSCGKFIVDGEVSKPISMKALMKKYPEVRWM